MFFLGTKVFSTINDDAKDFKVSVASKPSVGCLVMLDNNGMVVEADGTKPILGCVMGCDDLATDYVNVQLKGSVRAKVPAFALVGFAPFYDSLNTDSKPFATGGLVISKHADFYNANGQIEANGAVILLGGA